MNPAAKGKGMRRWWNWAESGRDSKSDQVTLGGSQILADQNIELRPPAIANFSSSSVSKASVSEASVSEASHSEAVVSKASHSEAAVSKTSPLSASTDFTNSPAAANSQMLTRVFLFLVPILASFTKTVLLNHCEVP